MDDADAQKARAKLDAALVGSAPSVGIMFGAVLFGEFRKRGWLTLETFGALGTTLFSSERAAYDRTHFAFVSSDIPDLEFQVGTNA